MRALCIGWTDSYNFALPPCVESFEERGHEVELLLNRTEDEHRRMFDPLDTYGNSAISSNHR